MERPLTFGPCFEALTGHMPLRWQARLYDKHFRRGAIPGVCDLPTGLGKTSVMPIWLIAFALWAEVDGASRLPRRLVYIVNRRTVVDQATDAVERIRERLKDPSDGRWNRYGATLREIAGRLRVLSASCDGDDVPLGVTTLRGELADNQEWKTDPARPAIIVGTIDMIGSKLLFAGYGDGRYGRAHHAGLIGQDALIVHDEAHLSPAFDVLLRSVAAEQERCGEPRQFRLMSLSATSRAVSRGASAGFSFGIAEEDRLDDVVSQRLIARKSLTVVDADKGGIVARIAEEALSLGESPARVLVYVRSPEAAAGVAGAIEKGMGNGGDSRIAILTGTIRGKERDELAQSAVFRSFRAGSDRSSPLSHTLYLVSTSAGEVGADLDADHLVCDLTTLDSMAQRFGRVNRLGGDGRSARIVVVRDKIPDKDPLAAQRCKAAELLITLPALHGSRESAHEFDASPAALSSQLATPEAQAAFSPVPTILPATDIVFDHWSLTSIAGEMPGRPEVGPYLRGVAEWEPPETHVAWRADVALLAAGGKGVPCSTTDLETVFEVFPLRSVEQLRDRTGRVQEQLDALAERLRKGGRSADPSQADDGQAKPEGDPQTQPDSRDENKAVAPTTIPADPWVVLMRGSFVRWVRLSELAPDDKRRRDDAMRILAFATVVLPVEAGGLKGGMLEGDEPAPGNARSLDVAEAPIDGARDRQRVVVSGDDGPESSLLGDGTPGGQFVARHAVALPGGDDEEASQVIEYRVAKGQDREPGEWVGLSAHNAAVASAAERVAKALGLDDSVVRAIALAGRLHDEGKARANWQRYANNDPHRDKPGGPIAKSDRYGHWKQLGGYRHEFGSLLDAAEHPEVTALDAEARDLVLHLVAAHHGWARPHFESRHFDRTKPSATCEQAAVEAMQRFARLQQRFGRCGLAWLESLLRCADAEASESPALAGKRAGPSAARDGAAPGGAT